MYSNIVEGLTAIAKTKNLSKAVVFDTLKESLSIAAKKYLDLQKNIEVEIDEGKNLISVFLRVIVVDDFPEVEPGLDADAVQAFDEKYMLLDQAHEYNQEATVGDLLEIEVPIENFGRAAIATAKQMLLQKIRDAEREIVFQEYKDKIDSIVSGTVQQVDRGNILVALGRAEAVLPGREQIRKERYRQGDTIRAYVVDVNSENKGAQIVLSRAHPGFLAKLFELEVPEIADGTVIVKAVARDPGFRAKIAVISKDGRIDPVGACVGMKGNRVQAIVRELSNERIDIINWVEDFETYLRRSLSPADVKKITDPGDGRAVIIVGDDDLSQAIGRNGQNVRLASRLVGRELDIYGASEWEKMTEEEQAAILAPRERPEAEPAAGETEAEAEKLEKFSSLESLFRKPE